MGRVAGIVRARDRADADSLGGEDWGVGGDYFVVTMRWVVLLGFNSTIVRIHRLESVR